MQQKLQKCRYKRIPNSGTCPKAHGVTDRWHQSKNSEFSSPLNMKLSSSVFLCFTSVSWHSYCYFCNWIATDIFAYFLTALYWISSVITSWKSTRTLLLCLAFASGFWPKYQHPMEFVKTIFLGTFIIHSLYCWFAYGSLWLEWL